MSYDENRISDLIDGGIQKQKEEFEEQRVSELLKPRFKVIADFPDSDYKVWNIEDRDWTKYVNGEDETDGVLWRISDFPHLFKKLEWWEERSQEEMPKYIKSIHGKICDEVLQYDFKNFGVYIKSFNSISADIRNFIPATEQEYTQYLSLINKQK